jgi:hypothetical protein
MFKITGDKIQLKIKNWDKFNPRKDVKQASWFRLQNTLFDDSDLFNLTTNELCFLVYLFCLASKKNTPTITLSLAHAKAIGRFDEQTIANSLSKLVESETIIISNTSSARVTRTLRARNVHGRARIVDVTRTLRARNVHDTRTGEHVSLRTNERTNEQTNNTNTEPSEIEKLEQPLNKGGIDLLKIYNAYPRKVGKSKGLQFLNKDIKTPEEADRCLAAVQKYKAALVENGTDGKFIKHFSTFAHEWRDWAEPDAGSSKSPKDEDLEKCAYDVLFGIEA